MSFEAFLQAARNGDASVIKAILQSPGGVPQDLCFAALSIATENQDVEAVRMMLAYAPSLSYSESDRLSYAQYYAVMERATAHHNADLVRALVSNPCAGRSQNIALFVRTLGIAASKHRNDIVENLLGMPDFAMATIPLDAAIIQAENTRAVELLLNDPRCDVPGLVLDKAAQTGNAEMVRAVLRDPRSEMWLRPAFHNLHQRDFNVASLVLSDPRILEFEAVMCRLADAGREDLIASLLQNPRLQPSTAQSVLWHAAAGGHAGIVRMLLADGRWSPTSTRGRAAMTDAARRGYIDVVTAFLEDARVTGEPDHVTIKAVLIASAAAGREDVVRRLLAVPGRVFSPPELLMIQLTNAGQIRMMWRLLLADEHFVVGPGILQMAVQGRRMLALRLFLRDPRVRDIGHQAIQEAVSRKNREAFVRLLVSWDDPVERQAAVQASRPLADEPLRNFIDDIAGGSNGWFECMNVLCALTHGAEMPVLSQLAHEADRQGLDGATLRRLHAQGWLEPTIDSVIGRELSESFSEVFESNYETLARFSAVSATLELSPVPIGDAMPELIRRMTADLSERATDVLWRRVCENRTRALAGTSENGVLSHEHISREEQAGMLADLSADCIRELRAKALDLPREHAPRREAPYAVILKLRSGYVGKLKEELRSKERDANISVRGSAGELTQALERFSSAAQSRRADAALSEARKQLQEALKDFERALSLAGQKVDARLLAAAEEFSQMPTEKLFAADAAVLLVPRRDITIER